MWKPLPPAARVLTLTASVLGVTLAAASPVAAESIRLDQGFITIDPEGTLFYTIGSAHFGAQRTGAAFPWLGTGLDLDCSSLAGCSPTERFNATNATTGVVSLGHGNTYFHDTFYPDVDFTGSFRFTSNGASLPITGQSFDVAAPFSFAGMLTATSSGRRIFSVDLAGFGRAQTSLVWNGTSFATAPGVGLRYKFTESNPAPEPASMLLLGTGAAMIARAIVRRRTKDGGPSR
jgi:hypothetical protein